VGLNSRLMKTMPLSLSGNGVRSITAKKPRLIQETTKLAQLLDLLPIIRELDLTYQARTMTLGMIDRFYKWIKKDSKSL
jgi:hypothetical protein